MLIYVHDLIHTILLFGSPVVLFVINGVSRTPRSVAWSMRRSFSLNWKRLRRSPVAWKLSFGYPGEKISKWGADGQMGHDNKSWQGKKRYISTSCCVSIDLHRSESFPKCLRECYLWNAWKPRGVLFQTEKTQPSDLSSQSGHSAGTKSLSLVRLQQSEGPVHDTQTYGIKCRVDQTYKVFGQSRYFKRSVFNHQSSKNR